MIFIGIGANLPAFGKEPLFTCIEALSHLTTRGVTITCCSRWIESAPIPPSDQPWFTNGVALVETSLSPSDLLTVLHQVEMAFSRVRTVPNAPRVLDLDLLAYHNFVSHTAPILPHPRLHERAFVVWPLAEIAPYWHHPTRGQTSLQMAITLPPGQRIRWITENTRTSRKQTMSKRLSIFQEETEINAVF